MSRVLLPAGGEDAGDTEESKPPEGGQLGKPIELQSIRHAAALLDDVRKILLRMPLAAKRKPLPIQPDRPIPKERASDQDPTEKKGLWEDLQKGHGMNSRAIGKPMFRMGLPARR